MVSVPFTSGSSLQLAYQLDVATGQEIFVSVPFTSGSSLQRPLASRRIMRFAFQFPLHRDPRCNQSAEERHKPLSRFSSLYIGILAATYRGIQDCVSVEVNVSVPFTSGSSLQLNILLHHAPFVIVSVPFTSGSSLQLSGIAYGDNMWVAGFSSLYIGILAAT